MKKAKDEPVKSKCNSNYKNIN